MHNENCNDTITEFIHNAYDRMRAGYPDAIILLQTADAYLAIHTDAQFLNRILSLPLREPTDRIPVVHTVFPGHAFDDYMDQLAFAHILIAVCSLQPPPAENSAAQLTLF